MSYKKYNNYQSNNKQAAVALGYKHGIDIAPKVLATGKGIIAEQIIAKAKEHNIPIEQDDDLMKILSILELDSIIPMEAYAAIAEILSTLYKYNDNIKKEE